MKALLVGAGTIARQHLSALTRLDQVTDIHVCDRSAATARAMADRFDLTTWSADYMRALDEFSPDVVHVTTPPGSHVELSRLALEAGCHVMVEKPASPDLEQLKQLVALAESRGRLIVEDFNYLFNPSVRQILDGISTAEYGHVVHASVDIALNVLGGDDGAPDLPINSLFQDAKGGPAADFLPHLASVLHALIGKPLKATALWSKSPGSPFTVDAVRALVRGEQATGSIGFSPIAQPDLFSIEVEGTLKRIRANVFEGRSVENPKRDIAPPLMHLSNGINEGIDSIGGSLRSFAAKLSGGPGAYSGLRVLIGLLYDSLATGDPPPVTHRQMIEVAELIDALTGGVES